MDEYCIQAACQRQIIMTSTANGSHFFGHIAKIHAHQAIVRVGEYWHFKNHVCVRKSCCWTSSRISWLHNGYWSPIPSIASHARDWTDITLICRTLILTGIKIYLFVNYTRFTLEDKISTNNND